MTTNTTSNKCGYRVELETQNESHRHWDTQNNGQRSRGDLLWTSHWFLWSGHWYNRKYQLWHCKSTIVRWETQEQRFLYVCISLQVQVVDKWTYTSQHYHLEGQRRAVYNNFDNLTPDMRGVNDPLHLTLTERTNSYSSKYWKGFKL